jgi:hypothetical protein
MNITGVEINAEDVENLVGLVNNNIIEFKKIVHKLNSNYRNNRISINFIQNDINKIHKQLNNKYDSDNIIQQLNNINNSISELKLINSLSNLDNLANKIDNKNHLNINFKLACFGVGNIIITSLIIHYLT